MMPTSVRFRALLLVPVCGVLLASCGQKETAKSADEVKAFAGDPALKAKNNQADIAKAAQIEASRGNAAPVSPPPPPRR